MFVLLLFWPPMRSISRDDLDLFYDGPLPEDVARAAACGGWAILARLRASHTSHRCDSEARLILARRRRARLRTTAFVATDRAFSMRLVMLRAAGLAAQRASRPPLRGGN
ncbi:MAG: hypothetical protein SGJ07_07860 [Rhodospirillaceae bacterium]|nr:hypothetical protein [Rhodospirillaceae bacterium]